MPVRVLIIDDSAVMRSFLADALGGDPGIEVVGSAPDPAVARQKIKALNPDVITLDIEMPGMDGLTFLDHLMRLRPMPVVMVSSLTQSGAAATLRALELGAADFVAKPLHGAEAAWPEFTAAIAEKVKRAARSRAPLALPPPVRLPPLGSAAMAGRVIVLGGSTGAVAALQHILSAMPEDAPAMAAAVHMPAQFTRQFAARLDGLCSMRVLEAAEGLPLERGHVYLAPGDRHMTIARHGPGHCCRLEDGPKVSGHRPSVDVLFESVARSAASHGLGIILTGMGRDGAIGLRAMRGAGALTACQDEATSLIYGMPGAAVAADAVEAELPLPDIAAFILRHAAAGRAAYPRQGA